MSPAFPRNAPLRVRAFRTSRPQAEASLRYSLSAGLPASHQIIALKRLDPARIPNTEKRASAITSSVAFTVQINRRSRLRAALVAVIAHILGVFREFPVKP